MDKPPLRLLLAEDSEDDALLLLHHLKKDQWTIEHHVRVDSPETLASALTDPSWDLVITDHNMPSFDSEEVLKMVNDANGDIPVIIVSGSIGEELAVSMMKCGAADYIMKSNLTRLGAAIERELQEAKSREARRLAEDRLLHMAFHDSLTNLKNRHELEQALQKALEEARDANQSHAFMYLDLDQFKVVNDTCGHMAGDELLRQISAVLKKRVRESDLLARLGGDEFGVLLLNCPLDRAEQLANILREAVEAFRFIWEGRPFNTSVSIGLVDITPVTKSGIEVLSSADMACFAAKSRGRNRVHIYTAEDDELALRRDEMQWVSRINSALSENRFLLYQQPIVPLVEVDGPSHTEVLLRMQGPDGEIISPGAFIPAAERYDLMQRLDRWVVNSIFTYLGEHRQDRDQGQLFFINLSGTSLSDPGFFEFIQERMNSLKVQPQTICFEVTETAAINNLEITECFIQEIREMGCFFALDDFGAGLSSFSYLKSLSVDFLKVDGSFVKQVEEDEMSRAIVDAINTIGHVAGLKTIAEFVERQQTREMLQSMGVDFAQGYGIQRPQPLIDSHSAC
ncbi:MAG: EAL domain-containing protein [Candidatus Thiodiazotropha weberae]|uniref:Histidine kinase n=1 Tax=Candidatus Thiodiazotropha endoloripes TaxID=1818881 RepID=A0A1E2ULW5_9GAMM|nr:EAL domain-containing protein [Candidatus Thiodiazotropha endoloripes]MCG7900054.1 EAL domain-containing protein [Candidatus Thiodiazotropha weberae]MCG7903630.1 EAL domain-containing protein [Candidatus Thiodiazotropha weberae]ODB91585.1 histidine kinase [Candidatus Thiodiazotropha endoloripes]ODB95733.1 histidine kinase [Candidatus Thiodiazotropha endoloripes]